MMKRPVILLILLLVSPLAVADMIHVAPPTGDPVVDVANIQGAIDAAAPGDIVQFDHGTYVLESDVFPAPQFFILEDDITLRGKGNQGKGKSWTKLQGIAKYQDVFEATFFLVGNRTKLRKLTFDGFGAAINIYRDDTQPTGHQIEHCTFQNGDTPVFTYSFSDDLIHVRHNKFINTQLAIITVGKTVHFHNNSVTSPDPESMLAGKPFAVATVYSHWPYQVCENNVFSNNKVVGNADGIAFQAFPGEVCRNNIVRDNTFIDQRVWFPYDLGSMVILDANGGVMEGNIIRDNKIDGDQGIGIVAFGAAQNNLFIDNEFKNFVPGDVLPGLLDWLGLPPTGILLSPDSFDNYVIRNSFKNVPVPIEDLGIDNVIEDNVIE